MQQQMQHNTSARQDLGYSLHQANINDEMWIRCSVRRGQKVIDSRITWKLSCGQLAMYVKCSEDSERMKQQEIL